MRILNCILAIMLICLLAVPAMAQDEAADPTKPGDTAVAPADTAAAPDTADGDTTEPADTGDTAAAPEPASEEAGDAAKLGEDVQEESERRGMSFFRLDVMPTAATFNTKFPRLYERSLENLHNSINLKRFDIFDDLGAGANPDEATFLKKIAEFYNANWEEVAKQRLAATGKGYDKTTKQAVLTTEQKKQFFNSAFAYRITYIEFKQWEVNKTEKRNVPTGNGTEMKEVTFKIYKYGMLLVYKVEFYKVNIDLADANKPATLTLVDTVHVPKSIVEGQEMPVEEWNKIEAAQQLLMIKNWKDLVHDAIIATGISTRVKEIFKIRAKIAGVADERKSVYMKPGKAEGLRIDDGYWIMIGNNRKGYTKIRELGPGYVAQGDGVSKADQEQTKLQVIAVDDIGIVDIGTMLIENPMFGLDIELRFGIGFGLSVNETVYSDGTQNYSFEENSPVFVGGIFKISYDLGPAAGLSEWWLGISGQVGVAGDITHMMFALSIEKRIYGVFGLSTVLAVGIDIGYYMATVKCTGSASEEFSAEKIGGLALKFSGRLGYFISPSIELYAGLSPQLLMPGEFDEIEIEGNTATPAGGNEDLSIGSFMLTIELGIRIMF